MNIDAFSHVGIATWKQGTQTVRINKHLRWMLDMGSLEVSLRDLFSQFRGHHKQLTDFTTREQTYVSFPWVSPRHAQVRVEVSLQERVYTLMVSERCIPTFSKEQKAEDPHDLSVFFTNSEDLMCVFTADGYFEMVNNAFHSLLGYESEYIKKTHYSEFVHPDDLESSRLRVQFTHHHGLDTADFVNRFRKNDGEYVYISWKGLRELANGSVYLVGKDVTSTVKYVQSLSLYKRCFDIALDALIIAEADSSIVHANKKFCEIVGLPESEVIGKPFLSYVHPDDLEATLAIAGQMSQEGVDAINFKNRYRHADGSYVVLSWMGVADTEAGLVTGIARDVTEQEKFDKELKRTHEALSESQELANIGSWELNFKEQKPYWSDQTKRIHEVPMSFEPSYEGAVSFYTDEYQQKIDRDVKEAIANGESWDDVYQIKTYEGNLRWVRVVGKPEFGLDGGVDRLYGVFQDVTRQVEYEHQLIQARNAAEDASRQKADFLSMMSHEIRTPLNAIVSMSYFLKTKDPSSEQLDFLDVLEFSSENLMSLVNDILDFSKIEAGKIDLKESEEDLYAIFESVWGAFKILAYDKGIDLVLEGEPLKDKAVLIDRGRFVQILNNLLSNAVKFTDSGHVKISTRVESVNSHWRLHVSIQDSGCGMSEDVLESIYDPFMQVATGSTRKHGGTGLGLTISKRLVDLMGGHLSAKSSIGEGSTFTFSIELKPANSAVEDHTKAPDTKLDISGKHVLLVEDNETNVFVAKTMLENWGCSVDVAYNGQEAVDAFDCDKHDVVLMDLHMPVMNGEEASGRIKATQQTKGVFVPIIALTASALSESRDRVLAAGLDDFVTKPINPSRLKDTIAKNLEKSS